MPRKKVDVPLDAPHPAQALVSRDRKRFNVLSCGRRWGKTHLTSQLVAEVVAHNLNNGLAEDMGYMSPTYKNLAPTWRNFKRTFKKIISSKNEQEHTAEILDSFVIEFWSLDKPENIRGRKYKRIIIDEAALIIALRQIFKLILLPTVGDLMGDVWFFSTPRGFNDFHYYYELGKNPIFGDWNSWIMPTSTNPYFPKEELENQRGLLDPLEYAQEWEGKFVALGNNPFDLEYLGVYKTLNEALFGQMPLYQLRYWDIANSADGDYTASSKLTVTDRPQFIISDPVRYRGVWGSTYPMIKQQLLMEPEVMHIFETEGIGGIAWQMIQMDNELAGIKKYPAGRVFTSQSKEERANLWALEMRSKRVAYVEGPGMSDVLDEMRSFPAGEHDDYVDGISGNFLAFVFFCGGYQQLMKSRVIEPQSLRPSIFTGQKSADIIHLLGDEFSN